MTYFTGEQVSLLLKPIHPKRVLMRDGMSYVEGYDVKAELNRVFGFGRWSVEILDQSLIAEAETKTRNNKDAWYVVYKTSLRLTVSAPDGTPVCRYEESHVGESTHPVRGEAHGNALTNSWTYALKRCASNLGDQFGLSLYGKGSMDALVRWTLVRPDQGEGPAVNDQDVPQVTAEAPEDHAAPELHVQAPPPPVEQRAEPQQATAAQEPAGDRRVTDQEWLTATLTAACTFATEKDGGKLWRETAAKHKAGECTDDDRESVEATIRARIFDIRAGAVEGVVVDKVPA